jgi:hypothetical protein
MREKDYSLGVDLEAQKKALAEFGIFSNEQVKKAAGMDLNIAAFVIPYDEVMKNAKEDKSA